VSRWHSPSTKARNSLTDIAICLNTGLEHRKPSHVSQRQHFSVTPRRSLHEKLSHILPQPFTVEKQRLREIRFRPPFLDRSDPKILNYPLHDKIDGRFRTQGRINREFVGNPKPYQRLFTNPQDGIPLAFQSKGDLAV